MNVIRLEELPRLPEQAIELGAVVAWAEPRVEHEVLGRRDRRDGVDLEEPEAANGREDAARGAVEGLRPHGDPPRLLARDLDLR